MSMLNIQTSFFSIGNPFAWVDRLLNDFNRRQTIRLNQRELVVCWTRRADRALSNLRQPLIVELQLYFSCVVKKRVLFHRQVDFETVSVNKNIEIAYRPVASAVCNPEEFARHYPEGKSLVQGPASRMIPKLVEIDYLRGQWQGQFNY
jgi:hypothetical protein